MGGRVRRQDGSAPGEPVLDLGCGTDTVAALVTHARPQGQEGAVVQAVAVALAAHTTPGEPVDPDWFVNRLLAHLPGGDPLQFSLPQVADMARWARTPFEVAANLGNAATAIQSVPTALATFLMHADDPRQALRWAITAAGDTDTIASMTGALAGARHGDAMLPARWLANLEASQRIVHAATSLASLPSFAWSAHPPPGMVYDVPARRLGRLAEWIVRGR